MEQFVTKRYCLQNEMTEHSKYVENAIWARDDNNYPSGLFAFHVLIQTE